jgi:hypothetical protein
VSADDIRYEKTDARVAPIVKYAIGLLVFTAVTAAVAFGVMHAFREYGRKSDPATPPMAVRDPSRLPPEPRLQIHPTVDAAELHRQEQELLDGYGWVDGAKGTVRIPIARAMELLVARGVPTRAAAPSPATATSPVPPLPGQPAMVQEADSPDLPGEPDKPKAPEHHQ